MTTRNTHRPSLTLAACALVGVGAAVLSGCTARADRAWAQTAGSIEPGAQHAVDVRLSAMPDERVASEPNGQN